MISRPKIRLSTQILVPPFIANIPNITSISTITAPIEHPDTPHSIYTPSPYYFDQPSQKNGFWMLSCIKTSQQRLVQNAHKWALQGGYGKRSIIHRHLITPHAGSNDHPHTRWKGEQKKKRGRMPTWKTSLSQMAHLVPTFHPKISRNRPMITTTSRHFMPTAIVAAFLRVTFESNNKGGRRQQEEGGWRREERREENWYLYKGILIRFDGQQNFCCGSNFWRAIEARTPTVAMEIIAAVEFRAGGLGPSTNGRPWRR